MEAHAISLSILHTFIMKLKGNMLRFVNFNLSFFALYVPHLLFNYFNIQEKKCYEKVVTTPKHAFIANDLCVMGTW